MKFIKGFFDWMDDCRGGSFKHTFMLLTAGVWIVIGLFTMVWLIIAAAYYLQWYALCIPFLIFFLGPIIWYGVDVCKEDKKIKRQVKELI